MAGHELPITEPEAPRVTLLNLATPAQLGAALVKFAGRTRRLRVVGGRRFDVKPHLRRFLRQHPEWTVVAFTRTPGEELPGGGRAADTFTIEVSRRDEDKRPLPGLVKQAWNFTKALAADVAAGSPRLPLELAEARLAECDLCPARVGNRCGACGCYLDEMPTGAPGRAFWAVLDCPLGRWPELPADWKQRAAGAPPPPEGNAGRGAAGAPEAPPGEAPAGECGGCGK